MRLSCLFERGYTRLLLKAVLRLQSKTVISTSQTLNFPARFPTNCFHTTYIQGPQPNPRLHSKTVLSSKSI